MKRVKWLIILLGLLNDVLSQPFTVNNTCSQLGTYPPDNPGKCTVSSSSGEMCCYVSVKFSTTNSTKNFCAKVTGSYLNAESVSELEKDIGPNYKVSVICSSSILSISLVILILLTSLIIF